MKAPVDVLLPYYGDVDFMKKAVESILKQSFTSWRLLVFDDGFPSDEPKKFFASIDDDRVFYSRNDQNLGANGNYSKALDFAEAQFFIMMGADDIMHVDYLSNALEAIGDADFYQPSVNVIDEFDRSYLPLVDRIKRKLMPYAKSGEDYGECSIYQGEEISSSLVRGNWLYFPSILWRTASAQQHGFNKKYEVVQDLCLALDILTAGGSMVVDKRTSFSYRRHSKSDSSVRAVDARRFKEEKCFFDELANNYEQNGWHKAARSARRHAFSRLNALSIIPKSLYTKGGRPLDLLNYAVK
ncbi:MAG: glycosyltransferase [Candidatus Ancillula sp.]|jgi:glycosyltransferase involved in cell wall biosynthesis|nr:glycosyltransferase [Candidatus Ancillula sp.]